VPKEPVTTSGRLMLPRQLISWRLSRADAIESIAEPVLLNLQAVPGLQADPEPLDVPKNRDSRSAMSTRCATSVPGLIFEKHI
jgi:hypothetical protein